MKFKKKTSREIADSIRKPVPPPGHAHDSTKDYRRKPKHRKPLDTEQLD